MIQRNQSDEDAKQTAISRGVELEAFFRAPTYRIVLDWFDSQVEEALKRIRRANHLEEDNGETDRFKANLQLKWATIGHLTREFELMVQDAIIEKNRINEDNNVESQ